jgi:hypothetical protein
MFTYDPTQPTDLDRIRFHVGDTMLGYGVKPNGANLENEEITAVLLVEETWQRAVAGVFEMLAAAWATHVDMSLGDATFGRQTPSVRFEELAKRWRERFGGIGNLELVGGTIKLGYQYQEPTNG